jgi:hypothetical protein
MPFLFIFIFTWYPIDSCRVPQQHKMWRGRISKNGMPALHRRKISACFVAGNWTMKFSASLYIIRDLGQTCQTSRCEDWWPLTFITYHSEVLELLIWPSLGLCQSSVMSVWSVHTDRTGPVLGRYLENSNIRLEYHPGYHF